MSFALLCMIILCIILLFFKQRRYGSIFNGFFFVVIPYVVIIFINNIWMQKKGFSEISEKTIIIFTIGLLIFYAGTSIGNRVARTTVRPKEMRDLSNVVQGTLYFFSVISCSLVSIDVLMCIRRYGIANYITGGETFARSSITEHLSLILVVLSIVLVEYYFEYKKKVTLFLLVWALGLIFSSFIKYHIISTLLAIIIYIALAHPKQLKKIGIIVGILIFCSFVLTYVITFNANKVKVNSNFYLNHLWGYIAGGTINVDNALDYFSSGSTKLSIVLWIWEMITSFPTMITNKIFGFSFTDYVFCKKTISFNLGASDSNVVCIPGAAYVQGGIIGFMVFTFIMGIVIEWVFEKAKDTQMGTRIVASSIFLSYCMLSFFSSFFELSAPWETILLVFIIIRILNIKFIIKH